MSIEAMKLALEALEEAWYHVGTFQPTEKAIDLYDEARTAIKEALAQPEEEPLHPVHIGVDVTREGTAVTAFYRKPDAVMEMFYSQFHPLAQPEQEPVAWLITDEKINNLQVDSIQRLIDRARHAHMTDIKLRINGQDEWYQADWLKHLTRTTPPQRTWVGLTSVDWNDFNAVKSNDPQYVAAWAEAKLKEKNT